MIYLKLFWAFFQIGMFSIGGGYAAMPFISRQAVEINSWLTMNEFADIITISQMTPGPIAVNAATFVGIRTAGFLGAVTATAGCVLPSCIIVMCMAKIYYRYKDLKLIKGIMSGLRPAVVALIASAGVSIFITAVWNGANTGSWLKDADKTALFIFTAALLILRIKKPNQIYVMLASGAVGGLMYYFFGG